MLRVTEKRKRWYDARSDNARTVELRAIQARGGSGLPYTPFFMRQPQPHAARWRFAAGAL